MALLPGAPERAEDRGGAADEAAGAGERARLVEDVRRVGVVAIPPREDRPGLIDRCMEQREPGEAKLRRSEEHTSELQSLMRISYAVFCLKKKKKQLYNT